MKAQIHPQWFAEAVVTCACGNSFTTGATQPSINVDVCYNCHPFYTGQMKYLDTAGRIDAFKNRQAKAGTTLSKAARRALKRDKQIQEERSRPESLSQLRGN